MSESAMKLPQSGDALLMVDVQNDFVPGGALAVPHGHEVVPILNEWIQAFEDKNLPIFATRDWHPQDHCSFHPQNGIWPPHCVQDTWGAQFVSGLILSETVRVISKASTQDQDAYSGFQGTSLHLQLQSLRVSRVFVGGLATDYCVLSTVKDAIHYGYEVILLGDAIPGVNVKPQDSTEAIRKMIGLGANFVEKSHQFFLNRETVE